MRTILGISDKKNAYLYELEIDNLGSIILELDRLFFVEKRDIVLCDFYKNDAHNYGKYEKDIENGYASVIYKQVKHIDRGGLALIDDSSSNCCFGVIELVLQYRSQIARIISRTFSTDFYEQNYKAIDLTDLMKVENNIRNIQNTFNYDSVVDKRLRYMNTEFNFSKNDITNINKDIFLNEKEREISVYEYGQIIKRIADNIRLKLVATYSLNETYNEEIEDMKRYAIRNSKIFEMCAFTSMQEKLVFPIRKDDVIKPSSKKLTKKYDYNNGYNVYLQNADNCDII